MIPIIDLYRKETSILNSGAEVLGIAIVYAIFGWLGQSLAIPPGNVTAVWPPSGFALTMVLFLGKRAWAGIFLGAFIINAQAFFDFATIGSMTTSFSVGLSIAVGSLIQPVVGANLIQRFARGNDFLQTVKNCLVFVCVIPVMCLISSSIGTVSLYFGGFISAPNFAELWVTWWLGDAIGVLVLTPFLLAWFRQQNFALSTFKWMELTVVTVLLILFTFIGFGEIVSDDKPHYPIEFLVGPFLLWLALRFRASLAISGMLIVCAIAIWKTTQGSGPFQLDTPNLSLLMLQLFLFVTAISVMFFTSLGNERADAVHDLRSANDRLEEEVAERNLIEDKMRKMHSLLESKYEQKSTDLHDKQSRLEAVIDSAPVCIHEIDREGKLISMNPAGLRMMGVEDEKAIRGMDYLEIPKPEDQKRVRNLFDKALVGISSDFEFNVPVNDATIYFSSSFSPILDDKGNIIKVMGVTQDLTERIELEEQIRRTQKTEALGQLSGGLAHDFNNILGIVQGNLELIKMMFSDNEEGMHRVNEAIKGVSRGSELTRKLLGFSRTRAHTIQHLSANTILRNMEGLISRSLTASIQVEMDYAKDLWPIEVDTGDFEDTIMNLSLNARDAMPDGGNLIISTVNTVADSSFVKHNPGAQAREYVVVSFSDNGSGMTDEVKEKVFEPFFTTKDIGKGTGLGLSMVFGFIKRSGGFIKIDSKSDTGTNVQLFLPHSTQSNSLELSEKEQSDIPRGTETILVVDDEDSLRTVTSIKLEQLGYSVELAANSDQALEKLKESPSIDLMFSDIIMPGSRDGRQLAVLAHRLYPQLEILLTSGYIRKTEGFESDEDSRFLKDITQNHLHKPYSHRQLAVSIRKMLDKNDI